MITGNILRDAVISAANNISNNRHAVDELNVFPVPDGDTGTNMSMTIANASKEVTHLEGQPASVVAKTVASALLRGARGNSGVILSLIFRGFSKGFKDCEEAGAEEVAKAFELGTEAAYKAVMKPTEGTILTVVRVASEYARLAANDGEDELKTFAAAIDGAKRALAETPEILPVLKKAGVVDAGGRGLVVILEGMYTVLSGGAIIEGEQKTAEAPKNQGEGVNAAGEFDGDITFTYCTEFIVKRQKDSADPSELRAYLESIGDCVVVVDDEDIIKVHVHTDHPGNAFEKGLTFGQLVNMKIENMRDQHERAKHDAHEPKPTENLEKTEVYTPAAQENPYGFVAVSAGKGLEELFHDIGVDIVVSGGQTMNPSTDDILKAIELTPAKTVFVLPNNKNIIMAAEQAVPLATRRVVVLQTRTVPQGISAMLAFDPETDYETNAINMRAAYERVGTGQITYAARDSEFDGFKIKKGELLAMANGKITFTDINLEKTVVKLTKSLVKKDTGYVTLIFGEDVSEEKAEAIRDAVAAKLSADIDVTLINGGQPVYYFVISVE